MPYRFFAIIKLILLAFALALASFLAFGDRSQSLSLEQKIVFVLDINRTMNTKDVLSGSQSFSRLALAKKIIHKIILSEPQFSYGLILFDASSDYIIPPTSDTGTFFLYLNGITTNLLPDGAKNFAQLSGFLRDELTSYIILSDFDAPKQNTVKLPKGTSLLGLGSLVGDKVRYSNGVLYYDHGKSIFSARNDQFAQSLGLSYTPFSNISDVSLQKLLSRGFNLPMSQRIFLYTLLGILVILVVLL